jgi:hypothetical protein
VLQDAHLTMDGGEATDAAEATLLATLNPVVDLDRDLHLYGAIDVKEILLSGDRLVASGPTKIPLKPSQ